MSQSDFSGSRNMRSNALKTEDWKSLEETPTNRLGAYLRRLREGYGYTLRKVEEQAFTLGESIDNSQLSRFEKGKAVPSFDKLRALARIFNIPVQSFSDVLDLEEFAGYVPETTDYKELISYGSALVSKGDFSRAFVCYEKSLRIAESTVDPEKQEFRQAESRWRMATTLKRLGKLSMAERELRELLKNSGRLDIKTRTRAILQLSYLYRELGELFLSSVMGREALELARKSGDAQTEAGVLNTLANIAHAEGEFAKAIDQYESCLTAMESLGGNREMSVIVRTNLGGCMTQAGREEEGIAILRKALSHAKEKRYRRAAALCLTRLGEAFLQADDLNEARKHFGESDMLAASGNTYYHDILFLNAYRRWELARGEQNGTREKIAFGRLRHLRALIQRKFPEVESFDAFVEENRRNHANS
jgi:tetratricopeptide (TPR) repeat protein